VQKTLYLAFHFAFVRSFPRLSRAGDVNGPSTTGACACDSVCLFVPSWVSLLPLQALSKAGKKEAGSAVKWENPCSFLLQIFEPFHRFQKAKIKRENCMS